ncbi:MAG: ABC transporter permease [Kiritimatiellia bacterium]
MIRRMDQIRLSVQKLRLRKKRAFFSVTSVALGVVAVVVINSLARSARELAIRTNFSDDLDHNVIRVYAVDSPYEYASHREKQEKQAKRVQFMNEALFTEWRAWPEVAAVARPGTANEVGIDAFTNQPNAVSQLTGVPEALLHAYVANPAWLARATNAIPLVIGERYARLRFNPATKCFERASAAEAQAWLGREVLLHLGDTYAGMSRFTHDYEKKQWVEISATELAQQRAAADRNNPGAYDPTVANMRLTLRGRVVGICPGNRVLAPLETVMLCDQWITQRRALSVLAPPADAVRTDYTARGRHTPRPGEFTEGLVVVKPGTDIEAVAARLRKLGFTASTRTSAFESMIQDFDSGLRMVKRIAYAIAAAILAIAAAMLWSTTSRIVSDSRADIGLFRALGATQRDVRQLFLSETVLLGWLGTIAGILIGWALAWYISRWGIDLAKREMEGEDLLQLPDSLFTIDWAFVVFLLLGAAVIAWLAGYWPARRAANMDPIQALKRE